MICLKRLIVLLLAMFADVNASAQDPHFTQSLANYAMLNPALTGISNNPRINLSYRNQWPSKFAGSGGIGYLTTVLNYDQRISPKAGYIGIIALNDIAGDAGAITNSFALQYAYDFKINENINIRTGANVGCFQRSIDFSKLKFGDMISRGPFIDTTRGRSPYGTGWGHTGPMLNFSLGGMVSYKNLYAGIGINNLLEPMNSFFGNPSSRLSRRYSINTGGFFPLHKDNPKSVIFAPYIVFQRQAQFMYVLPGLNVNKGIFTGGISVRQTDPNTDAVNFLVGISKGWFKAGYSYDHTVSDIRTAATGSHEISLSFYLGKLREGSDKGLPYYFRKMGF